ncbi:hypothetical protein V4C53_45645, partial [Paraburkholderia azotifigens]|uniref:hypothetical protein n=1 Tax=Paraburkholderia azotifigens TaxID=2057004 RepID=UPI00317A0EF0
RHVHILDRPEKPSPIAISRTSSPDGMGLKLRPLPRTGATHEVRIRNRGCQRKTKSKKQKAKSKKQKTRMATASQTKTKTLPK